MQQQTPPCVPNKPHFPSGLLPSPPLHRPAGQRAQQTAQVQDPPRIKRLCVIDFISCSGNRHRVLCSGDSLQSEVPVEFFFIVCFNFVLARWISCSSSWGLARLRGARLNQLAALSRRHPCPTASPALRRCCLTRWFFASSAQTNKPRCPKPGVSLVCAVCSLTLLQRCHAAAMARFSGCRIPGRLFKWPRFPPRDIPR
jgi:hypothetical protein